MPGLPSIQAGGFASSAAGLRQDVARTLGEVLTAWRLVYAAFLRSGLIAPDPSEIFTVRQALNPHTAVILGTIGPLTVTTITAVVDRGQGLPMDQVFTSELSPLRKAGRTLMQVGMFADRRQLLSRCDEALFDLMRMAYYFGRHNSVTDLVVCVSPDHAPFYSRAFGLEYASDMRPHPGLNHTPVVMLRGSLQPDGQMQLTSPAMRYFADNPVSPEVFAGRFLFEPQQLLNSPLATMFQSLEPPGRGMRIA